MMPLQIMTNRPPKLLIPLLSMFALGSCGGTPRCDDAKALAILKQQGYDELKTIVTLSVNDKAANVTCSAEARWGEVNFRVFRTSEGKIAVAS